jgi:hypothetical protein
MPDVSSAAKPTFFHSDTWLEIVLALRYLGVAVGFIGMLSDVLVRGKLRFAGVGIA